MGKVKDLLKKAHVNDVYWGIMLNPPMSWVRHGFHVVRKDLRMDVIFPEAYNQRRNLPINEKKIVFVETRYDYISNSYELLYRELKEHYNFTIHVHYLREGSVSQTEYVRNCRRMLLDAATAKYVFLNNGCAVTSCIDKRPETIMTQLWHACGAFKHFGMSNAEQLFGSSAKEQRRHPNYANLDYVTVSSPEIIWAYAEAMDLKGKEETIVPTGVSRTDVFFQKDFHEKAYQHFYELFPAAKGKKVILYAPTYRGHLNTCTTPDTFDTRLFHRMLGDEYVVVMKHHPLVKKIPAVPEELKDRFVYDATRSLSIEEALCIADICITDYSSVIYEYSLLERPMLFYAYDLDEYYDWRGFYYNYDELTPGPVCRTNEEMIEYIQHLDERFEPEVVRTFRDRFMRSCDGNATKRIMDQVFGQAVLRKMRKKSI